MLYVSRHICAFLTKKSFFKNFNIHQCDSHSVRDFKKYHSIYLTSLLLKFKFLNYTDYVTPAQETSQEKAGNSVRVARAEKEEQEVEMSKIIFSRPRGRLNLCSLPQLPIDIVYSMLAAGEEYFALSNPRMARFPKFS